MNPDVVKVEKVELFIEQSMGDVVKKRTTDTRVTYDIHHGTHMDENGNVEKLIFKIESPWGLERAKALAQGRTTKLFTNPPPLFVRKEGMERQQKQIKMAAGLTVPFRPPNKRFFLDASSGE